MSQFGSLIGCHHLRSVGVILSMLLTACGDATSTTSASDGTTLGTESTETTSNTTSLSSGDNSCDTVSDGIILPDAEAEIVETCASALTAATCDSQETAPGYRCVGRSILRFEGCVHEYELSEKDSGCIAVRSEPETNVIFKCGQPWWRP